MGKEEEVILNVETVNKGHIAQLVHRTIVQLVLMDGPQQHQNLLTSPNAMSVRFREEQKIG